MNARLHSPHPNWPSRWTFVSAAGAMVLGIGNFWRLPWLASEYGGSAWWAVYLACLFFVAAPLMLAEVALGRRGRGSPVFSMVQLVSESRATPQWYWWAPLASVTALSVLAVTAIVSAWCLHYALQMFAGEFTAVSVDTAAQRFNELTQTPEQMLGLTGVVLLLCFALVALSVQVALARVLRVVLPVLLCLLAAGVYATVEVGDIDVAYEGLLGYRPEDLRLEGLVLAAVQAVLTLGVGLGVMMVYGSYSPERSIVWQVSWVVALDVVTAVAGGLMVLGLTVHPDIRPGEGVARLFVSLPFNLGISVFGDMVGGLFFTCLSLLGITTMVALCEPAISWLCERWQIPRPVAAALALAAALPLLAAHLLALSHIEWQWLGRPLVLWLDLLSAQVLVPLCALLLALFSAWRMQKNALMHEFGNQSGLFFWLWLLVLRYISAPVLLLVLVAGIYIRLSMS